MKRALFPRGVLPIALACSLLVIACSGGDPAKMLESARQYLSKNDNQAAIIQLKNALQEDPGLGEARFLLGKALLMKGDPVGAETELQKARDLAYLPDEVVPMLVRSRLLQGQYRKVTDEFDKVELTSAQANAELKTLVAVAWQQQGKQDAFLASLQDALKAQPDYAAALIEQARFKGSQRDFDGALTTLDSVLAQSAKNEEALKLKGDILLYGKGDPEQALVAYQSAIQAKPNFASAQSSLTSVLLLQGKMDQATQAIDELAKMAPGRPETLYLKTQMALQKKDIKAARDLSQQLLKLTPESPMALEVAGVAEYQANSMLRAEELLARAVQAAPQRRIARRALVLTHLRLGQVEKALASLPADIGTSDSDPAMLAVAGQVHMVNGDVEQAQQLFSRSAKLDPKDPVKRTSLAISELMLGKSELAFGELEDIASSDAGVVADLALINAHMQRRDVDKALVAIGALEKKRADDPMPSQLRGRALLLRNDRASARKAFERAQEISPDYFAATAALASIDLAERKPDEARRRLEAAVQRNPKNAQAWMGLAEIKANTGGSNDEVADAIRKAVEAAPNSKGPRVMLVDHYLRQKDAKTALSTAQTAVAALPDVPELVDALGRSQTASAEYNQALSSFNKLSGLMPKSPLPYLRMAAVHKAGKDNAAAMQSLRKALEVQPDLLVALRGLVELALQTNQPSEALAISRDVQKRHPKEAVGFALEGDVHMASKSWGLAAEAYRGGLQLVPSTEMAVKLHTALAVGAKTSDADRLAADWLKRQPKDVGFLLYLGDRAMASGKLDDAQRHYRRVVQLQPKNALALNNLAWVSGRLGSADAVSLAERANEAAPDQPALMDTLAMLLSEKSEHARAVALQKKVVELQPDTPVFKLNLAKILIRAGDKAEARALLKELGALGDKFSGQAEVQRLTQEH